MIITLPYTIPVGKYQIENDWNEDFDKYIRTINTKSVVLEASEGGRRSSQLPLDYHTANERCTLFIVILTNHLICLLWLGPFILFLSQHSLYLFFSCHIVL